LLHRTLLLLVFFFLSHPAYSQTHTQTEPDSLILIDSFSIYYASDAYELTKEHHKQLDKFLLGIDSLDTWIFIDSHTDEDGDDLYNQTLSSNRSGRLADWFVSKSLAKERIIENSHGEQFVTSEEGIDKSLDRRSEIRVYQKIERVELVDKSLSKTFAGTVMIDDSSDVENLVITVNHQGKSQEHEFGDSESFSLNVPLDQQVELVFKATSCFPLTKTIRLSQKSNTDNVKVTLVKLRKDATIAINVQFVGGKSIIRKEHIRSLSVLYSSLINNPEICLELAGHIHSNNATISDMSDAGFGLSIARSLEIYNYLVYHGIDGDRLLARGYGSTQLKYTRPRTSIQQEANRRVEAIVTSCEETANTPNDAVEDLSLYREP